MAKEFALRWGICSAGKISNDFVICLNMLSKEKHQVVAVGARDKTAAEKFASQHSIPKAYGSYQEVAEDPNVNIAYIGAVHTAHYRLTKMMLEAGKHVLCEKPLCVTLKETESLINIAKTKKLFMMEGVWSRFFPAYQQVRRLVREEVIGKAQHIQVQFGEYSDEVAPRISEKNLAGGALLDRGLYPVQFIQFIFDEKPAQLNAYGSLLETGVDSACHIFMRFSGNRTALASTSILTDLPNEAFICGPKGTIKVCYPLWCPTRVEVCLNHGTPEVYEYPLPTGPKSGKMNFRNCEGFAYEAEEVRNCIMKGLTECPEVTWDMSLRIAAIMDQARKEIGYDLPQDNDVY